MVDKQIDHAPTRRSTFVLLSIVLEISSIENDVVLTYGIWYFLNNASAARSSKLTCFGLA